MNDLMRRYAGVHLVRVFFEDYEQWRAVSPLAGIEPDLTEQTYEDLLKGTAADVSVPLWASACLSGEDILLNEITLEIILCYKKHGYRPVRMDGNPPDYVGEQFRFLEYLLRAALAGAPEAEAAAERFIDDYAAGTFRVTARAMQSYSDSKELAALIRLANACLRGQTPELNGALCRPETFDSWAWRLSPPIPPEPPRQVSCASFNDCGSKCKMLSTVQEGCVLHLRPDTDTPLRFAGCPRGAAYRGTFLSAKRLRYPMERVGKRGEGRFRRITWEQAEEKLAQILRESAAEGPGSRYLTAGAGNRGALRGAGLTARLLSASGGFLGYYGSYSLGAAQAILPRMFGTVRVSNRETELLRSELLLIWGNNLVTNHFGTAQKRVLMEAKKRGVRIVVIDPRRSDTALAAADRWIPIRPGTDAALADAMAWVIVKNGLHDQAFLDRFCVGFDEAHLPEGVPPGESYLSHLEGVKDGVGKTPAWAEAITGVPAETIEALALEYAKARRACILPGLAPQRTLTGEQTFRTILTLPCLIGALARPGGGVVSWSHPAGPEIAMPMLKNPYPLSIPAFQWQRAVECPETLGPQRGLRGGVKLDGPVRYLFCIASGMLLNQHSDLNRTRRILQEEDKIRSVVVYDVFMTPTARAADLLLPAPSFFETDNIVGPWGGEDYILYNHAAIEPLFGSRLELEWLSGAAERLGLEEAFSEGRQTLDDWLRACWQTYRQRRPDAPEYEAFAARSIAVFPHAKPALTFSEQIDQGVPFSTPSGKIELFLRELYDRRDPLLPGAPGFVADEEGVLDPKRGRFPLQMIGFHSKRRCHSIHDQNRWLDEIEPPRLWIHPDDAAPRKLYDGGLAEVFNDRGRIRLPAFVTERIIPGTVALSEGAWYTPGPDGTDERGSINVLTMSHRATPLANANPQHTNLVQVRAVSRTDSAETAP